MKRPFGIYLVAVWATISLLFASSALGRVAGEYRESGESMPQWLAYATLAVFAFIVWEVQGLLRLKRIQRWLCVAYFAYWTLAMSWLAVRSLLQQPARPVATVSVWAVLSVANIVSIIYLLRPAFRRFCCEYAAERESMLMRKAAQKRVTHDLKTRGRGNGLAS